MLNDHIRTHTDVLVAIVILLPTGGFTHGRSHMLVTFVEKVVNNHLRTHINEILVESVTPEGSD